MNKPRSNMAPNLTPLAPFARWTPRDKAAHATPLSARVGGVHFIH